MKTSIGSTFMYNIIIIFIVIIFAFIAGILSYYNAFKVSNRIIYAIEKFEGYNNKSIDEINNILTTIGYDQGTENLNCDETYKNMTLVSGDTPNFRYCIYVDDSVTTGSHGVGTYFVYGVKTYMSIDLPFVSWIRIPIYTTTNQIYKFTTTKPPIY